MQTLLAIKPDNFIEISTSGNFWEMSWLGTQQLSLETVRNNDALNIRHVVERGNVSVS